MPNVSHSPDIFDQYLGIMEANHKLINELRGLIVPKTPIDPGSFLDQYFNMPGTPLNWTPPIDRPALITNILISFTPAAAATFTIGQPSGTNRLIPIPASNATFPIPIVCAMVIHPGDVFNIVCSGATNIYLEIMGRLLSGTDWSQI